MASQTKRNVKRKKHNVPETRLSDLLFIDENYIPLPYYELVAFLRAQKRHLGFINSYLADILHFPPVPEAWYEHIEPHVPHKQARAIVRKANFIFADPNLRYAFLILLTAGYGRKRVYSMLCNISNNFKQVFSPGLFYGLVYMYWDMERVRSPEQWAYFLAYAKEYLDAGELELLQQAFTGYNLVDLLYRVNLPSLGKNDPRQHIEIMLEWVIANVSTRFKNARTPSELGKLWNVLQEAIKMLEERTSVEDFTQRLSKLGIPLVMEKPPTQKRKPRQVVTSPEQPTPKEPRKQIPQIPTNPADPLGLKHTRRLPQPAATGIMTPPSIYDDDDIPDDPW